MFTSKSLREPLSIGAYLAQQRLERGMRIRDIVERTKISSRYLMAIERSAYHDLPSAIFRVHYLRRYAAALGLPWSTLEKKFVDELARYRTDSMLFGAEVEPVFGRHSAQHARTHEQHALLIPRYLKIGTLAILILCVALYFLWSLIKSVSPPELFVTEPAEDRIAGERTLVVHGKTAPGAFVTINDQPVNVNIDGSFVEELSLLSGLNVIRVSSKTKHSTERVIVRNILYNKE